MRAPSTVGAGYATMAHVVRLAPAFIKIDRSLVAGLHVDREQRALVAALAAFAAQVGASCIAEGVEHQEQADMMAAFGCGLGQGYHLGRPADHVATAALLAEAQLRPALSPVP